MFAKITPERRVAQILCNELSEDPRVRIVKGLAENNDGVPAFVTVIDLFEEKLKELVKEKYIVIDELINDDQATV